MSELTWTQVSLLNVEAIDDAASYWSTYIDKLNDAADAVGSDVPTIIDERSFGGQTATGCRSQLQAIAGEIRDHIEEAGRQIRAVLKVAHEELSICKTDMRSLVDEVLDRRLRIAEDGEVYLSEARIAEIEAWAGQQAQAEGSGDADGLAAEKIASVKETECQPLTDRIRGLVETARGHDDDFTAQLHGIRDAYVQMPPPLGSDWHEQVAEYWANRVVHLINGGEDGELSAAELDELNQIAADHADSAMFTTKLMNQLGPGGLTTHLADVVYRNEHHDPDLDRFTADQVNETYEAFGLVLATATDPTNPVHVDEAWIAELMNLGGSEVTTSDGHWPVNGYELLAPALPHGQYHEDFLVPVTEHMIAIDASGNWSNSPPLTQIAAANGVDEGANPVNWALVALDNNPKAALNLFDGGGTGLADIDGVNLGDVEPVEDPYAYLMDRAGEYGDHTTTISPDLLGNALESATTGVSTNPAYAPETPPLHTPRMAALADRLIEQVTGNPDEFTGEAPKSRMIDNFGSITAAYIDDFHQAMGSPGTEDWAIDQPGADLLLASPSTENDRLASDWLRIVGHDQGAAAEVWGASEGLMYNQLESAMAHNDYGVQLDEPFEMHGGVTAALTVGSLDAIADGVYQQAADRNAVFDRFAEGVKFGAGVGAAYATGNPFVGAGVSQATGYGVDYVFDFLRTTEEEAEARIAELAQERLELNEDTMLSEKTLGNIEHILRTDPNLSEGDIQTLLHDYYRSYWDGVKLHYSRGGG